MATCFTSTCIYVRGGREIKEISSVRCLAYANYCPRSARPRQGIIITARPVGQLPYRAEERRRRSRIVMVEPALRARGLYIRDNNKMLRFMGFVLCSIVCWCSSSLPSCVYHCPVIIVVVAHIGNLVAQSNQLSYAQVMTRPLLVGG